MTLDEFVTQKKRQLDQFFKYWCEKNESPDKDNFPVQLPAGDWDEQFDLFCDAKEK